MPKGCSDNALTNKTEFMRYIDAHEECIPALRIRLREYRQQRPDGGNFGAWMRTRYLTEFCDHYQRWWLRHPELYVQVYAEVNMA